MQGVVTFLDGHAEDIWAYVKHDTDHITFFTESDRYVYVSYLADIDVPYHVSYIGKLTHKVHEFYQYIGSVTNEISLVSPSYDICGPSYIRAPIKQIQLIETKEKTQ